MQDYFVVLLSPMELDPTMRSLVKNLGQILKYAGHVGNYYTDDTVG